MVELTKEDMLKIVKDLFEDDPETNYGVLEDVPDSMGTLRGGIWLKEGITALVIVDEVHLVNEGIKSLWYVTGDVVEASIAGSKDEVLAELEYTNHSEEEISYFKEHL